MRAFEQRIALQLILDISGQILVRQFQELDRLLELRREREVLRQPELEGMLHAFEKGYPGFPRAVGGRPVPFRPWPVGF